MLNHPFYYGSAVSSSDNISLGSYMTATDLYPNIDFASMAGARIVGSSIRITQTQRLVDRAGYGIVSRIYG